MSFSWHSIEHEIASLAHDAVVGFKATEAVLAKIAAVAAHDKPVIDALTASFAPQLVPIERAAYAALGLVVKAANDVDAAGAAKGMNVTLDEQTWADFKALYAQFKPTGK